MGVASWKPKIIYLLFLGSGIFFFSQNGKTFSFWLLASGFSGPCLYNNIKNISTGSFDMFLQKCHFQKNISDNSHMSISKKSRQQNFCKIKITDKSTTLEKILHLHLCNLGRRLCSGCSHPPQVLPPPIYLYQTQNFVTIFFHTIL